MSEQERRQRAIDRAAARYSRREGGSLALLTEELEGEGIYDTDHAADHFERHELGRDRYGREQLGPRLIDTDLRERLLERKRECEAAGETFDAGAEARALR